MQALHFHRHTISAETLWQPLPPLWEMQPGSAAEVTGELCLPSQVLQHRALLMSPNGTPFSEVVETYTGNVLAIERLRAVHPC